MALCSIAPIPALCTVPGVAWFMALLLCVFRARVDFAPMYNVNVNVRYVQRSKSNTISLIQYVDYNASNTLSLTQQV